MNWDAKVDIIVAGAGGCGLTAALLAAEKGLEVAVFEKTDFILGNTAASAGMIPAAATRFQREVGIIETPEIMAEDILKKNKYESDTDLTLALCRTSGQLVEWLVDEVGLEMSLVKEFKYPGHRNHRMHAPPSRSGLEMIKKLRMKAMEFDNLYILLKSEVKDLITDEQGNVIGVEVETPDGLQKFKGNKVILATNGFGGNRELVKKYIPEIADALYFGYEANTGDALRMGMKIGALTDSLTAYQGHSAVNESRGILVTWGTVMMGGYMVNETGRRFGNEPKGYSEFAVEMMKQPNRCGYLIFDQEIFDESLSIEDFQNLDKLNGFKQGETIAELASALNLDQEVMKETFTDFIGLREGKVEDNFGRTHFPKTLKGTLYGIKVVPSLFHTQGGLKINEKAQVLHKSGQPIPNLYAGGGAAVGVSGKHSYGYMSGNGLLAALGFGKIAGDHATQIILEERMKTE